MCSFMSKKRSHTPRWHILAGGALIELLGGVPAAWGAFQKGVEQGYELEQDAVILLFSLIIAAYGVGCVLGGALQDKMGARAACLVGAAGLGGGFFGGSFLPEGGTLWLVLAFSLPVGLGCAFLYPAVMSCAQKWFPDRRGFATGVIGGAVGLSGAVLTLLARTLIGSSGIRGCFRVLGIAMAATGVLGALILREPRSGDLPDGKGAVKEQPKTGENRSDHADGDQAAANSVPSVPPARVIRTADYWLLLTSVACAAPTVLLFSPVILQLGQQRGLTENAAVLSIVVGSFTSAAGRLLMPWCSDRIGRRGTGLILFGALAAFSAGFAFAQRAWVIVLYAALTFCYSGQAALLPAFAQDRYGPRRAGVNYGLLALGMSVGSVAFPFLARAWQGDAASHWVAVAAAGVGFACLLAYGRGQDSLHRPR